jgi:hypothetical protein
MTFAELRPLMDSDASLSNPLVELENTQAGFPFSRLTPLRTYFQTPKPTASSLPIVAFCAPGNDQLMERWSTVEDRLFKIRHCMNIEGVERQLALFQPPIDPALLVKAVAAGLDIGSVLADLNAPLSPYRFQVVLRRARTLVDELKGLGASLLSALEKRDAEDLALLRTGHEKAVLKAARGVRQQSLEEAQVTRRSLEAARDTVLARHDHYAELLEDGAKHRLAEEKQYVAELATANSLSGTAAQFQYLASVMAMIPGFSTGNVGASPSLSISFGGSNIAASFSAVAGQIAQFGTRHSFQGNLSAIKAGWRRRDEDWELQRQLATKELAQVKKQIAAAQIREAMGEQEIKNLDAQIEQAQSVEDHLRDQYTNAELYGWMASQVSAVYYQTYKLAYDMAKQAERGFQFERGDRGTSYVQFGSWESNRKGLLAGNRLSLDLDRLEQAYLTENRREYEIMKSVSLVLHDPLALIALKQTGRCEFALTESLFDADYPGHYFRRIKSVSITIPAIVGPYTSVNCRLSMLTNRIRYDPRETSADEYGNQLESRMLHDFARQDRIAVSHAQSDTGVFELNFNDERYLPFEGAGAISEWRIDLPKETNGFDFATISDVVLTVRYTAREGGERLRSIAHESLEALRADATGGNTPLRRMFSLRHEFPNEWRALVTADPEGDAQIELDLGRERFPFLFKGRDIKVTNVQLFVVPAEQAEGEQSALVADELEGVVLLVSPDGADVGVSFSGWPTDAESQLVLGELLTDAALPEQSPGPWTLAWATGSQSEVRASLQDIVVVLSYVV